MKKWVDILFEIGQSVYLRTDPDQLERIVTGICIRDKGAISYEVSQGIMTGWHYGFELSGEQNEVKKFKENTI